MRVVVGFLYLQDASTHAHSASPAARKPHIIHILADDYGWADVGYHRSAGDRDVQTPNLDSLARSGIELDRFYVYQFCSPSRSSIQTGRNPVHVNTQNVVPECQNPSDPDGGFQGIPVNMTGMASHLRQAGYRTHMVGKWDIGMATSAHHPRARGYESWLGYWHHANDYWQHTVDSCRLGTEKIKDLWRFDADHDGPAVDLQNGPHCSQTNQEPKEEKCIYEEKVLTDRVKSIIQQHNASEPLFLFWSLHLVHMPLQVPHAYEQKFSFIRDKYRRLNHAMANYMDDEVGEVIALLKDRGIWNDTLVVFHSDNGGEIMAAGICGGNNWPLRGGKFSNFEGGIRVNAFVNGGVVPAARRGAKLEGYITGWDWYATYAALAGVDPTDHKAAAAGLPAHDSLDMWPWLSGAAAVSPRREVVVGETSALTPNSDGRTLVGGVIQGKYKILVGPKAVKWNALLPYQVSQAVLTGPSWPNSSSRLVPLSHPKTCGRKAKHGCLFDIFKDPSETTSIAEQNPILFDQMLARVDQLQKDVYSPDRGSKKSAACKIANSKYGGYWGPWLDSGSQKVSSDSRLDSVVHIV